MKFNELKITITFDKYLLIDESNSQKNIQATYTLDEQEIEEMLKTLDIKEEIEEYFQQIFEEEDLESVVKQSIKE